MRRIRVAGVIGAVAIGSLFSVGAADAKRCSRGKVKRHGKCVKVKKRHRHQRQGA